MGRNTNPVGYSSRRNISAIPHTVGLHWYHGNTTQSKIRVWLPWKHYTTADRMPGFLAMGWAHDIYRYNGRWLIESPHLYPSIYTILWALKLEYYILRQLHIPLRTRGLCSMKMLPVMILANYHSSARSAVSERPNSSARLVSQCPNSSAWLVSQCPNSSARLVFPMFQVELRLAFECSNSNTNDRQFEVCAFGWVFFTISITFCHSMTFMSMY